MPRTERYRDPPRTLPCVPARSPHR